MPELPEVEVVRRGLARWVLGRTIDDVDILDPRSIRRHALGGEDFTGNLVGSRVLDVVRRGKFLWLPLAAGTDSQGSTGLLDASGVAGATGTAATAGAADASAALGTAAPPVALMAHLGMSGQLLVQDAEAAEEKHLRVRLTLSAASSADGGPLPRELRFVDQRIFGGLFVTSMIPTADGHAGGLGESPLPLIPVEAAHIARDPLDPAFSFDDFFALVRRRKTGIKRALLDQSLVSGIGNIYADEALWAARVHYARPTDTMRRGDALRLIDACREVMLRALDAGGTSFDSLYVNVNGASGYFARSLNAYGREGEPCLRCASDPDFHGSSLIRREIFMNRSSFSCPRCQPKPRNGRW
ncbi:bifunctional DNA-formamidopyrimidine glycosylase/DNA-(apurinic or apyrimidinic site) lyase [Arthrobacter sp. 260]|uniref:bifunctional DNA-formamidopyrimidine glycosylase/DNA-(apurinic or apyrimidinic site) lyase n=1 Tax=Arthrobacter sp. 260 TaxID=2735314 RepID=UPI001492AB2F|nr:bifunctional DNA-formamidopyrimidine glycosylase/DNA-(apurinic or apyrimidinic site) lyase [Arthrobacter sp. 260]NOJ60361.1 bifunctional DNA-formamidopyrimidine glycosylase/DNA-(apurinic or apyrimidinic site) lyase [Arthrobacter sp. 260]